MMTTMGRPLEGGGGRLLNGRPLRIALLRGSANSNIDRLATILSLEHQYHKHHHHSFSVHLFTTALDAYSLAELERQHATAAEAAAAASTTTPPPLLLRHTSLRDVDDRDAASLLSRFD